MQPFHTQAVRSSFSPCRLYKTSDLEVIHCFLPCSSFLFPAPGKPRRLFRPPVMILEPSACLPLSLCLRQSQVETVVRAQKLTLTFHYQAQECNQGWGGVCLSCTLSFWKRCRVCQRSLTSKSPYSICYTKPTRASSCAGQVRSSLNWCTKVTASAFLLFPAPKGQLGTLSHSLSFSNTYKCPAVWEVPSPTVEGCFGQEQFDKQ